MLFVANEFQALQALILVKQQNWSGADKMTAEGEDRQEEKYKNVRKIEESNSLG